MQGMSRNVTKCTTLSRTYSGNITECRGLMQGMSRNVTKCTTLSRTYSGNITECRGLMQGMSRNVTKCTTLLRIYSEFLRNVEAETTAVSFSSRFALRQDQSTRISENLICEPVINFTKV